MRYIKKSKVVFILVFVFSIILVHMVQAVIADPGADTDPLVSQSYVDAKISELSQQIQGLQAQVKKFEVVDVPAGKQLVAGGSAEIILRQGQAKAVASSAGGLSDVTEGVDIQTGGNIPANHLLIVPRDDGRGLKATNSVKILIKGTYTIK